jgi:hypothetical protein
MRGAAHLAAVHVKARLGVDAAAARPRAQLGEVAGHALAADGLHAQAHVLCERGTVGDTVREMVRTRSPTRSEGDTVGITSSRAWPIMVRAVSGTRCRPNSVVLDCARQGEGGVSVRHESGEWTRSPIRMLAHTHEAIARTRHPSGRQVTSSAPVTLCLTSARKRSEKSSTAVSSSSARAGPATMGGACSTTLPDRSVRVAAIAATRARVTSDATAGTGGGEGCGEGGSPAASGCESRLSVVKGSLDARTTRSADAVQSLNS